jgi:drug/metabolite transporter (DMT)-like permease
LSVAVGDSSRTDLKIFFYTTLALVAFAFNSILCRLALRGEEADAAGFTAVRLVSGAVALVVINYVVSKGRNLSGSEGVSDEANTQAKNTLPTGRVSAFGSWLSAFLLFAYAICFSFAYLGLTAGTGALVLFGSVQLTMIAVAILRGERPSALEWLGLATAVGGLVYLVFPGLQSPPLTSSLLMAAAGAAWGGYTLRGKGSSDPLADTTGNFVRSVPMIVAVGLVLLPNLHLSGYGILLAVLSGAITSGIGYSFWYAALPHHTSFRAAVLQLPVPLLTAVLGIVLLTEAFTGRLLFASILILGGIGLTIFGRRR